MGSRGAGGLPGGVVVGLDLDAAVPGDVQGALGQWAPTVVSVMPIIISCSGSTMVNCPYQLGNDTHMVDKSQMEKYHYYYDKLTRCGYTVRLFGLPRFTAEK